MKLRSRCGPGWTIAGIVLMLIPGAGVAAETGEPLVVAHNRFRSTSTWTEYHRSLQVAFDGLQAWVRAGNDPKTLRLFLAGHMLKNEPTLISLAEEYISFELSAADEGDRKIWADILYEARQTPKGRIPVSVGAEDKRQPFVSRQYTQLNVYPGYWPWVVLLVAGLLVALFVLGGWTDLLRDGLAARPAPPARPPYSLGQVQMAAWFYLVIVSFLFIWLITGEYNTPTPSVLALIGISAGTGLAATFVDREKNQDAAAGAAKAPASRGFLLDLISDGTGISFHRFQILVWTVVLCIIFTREVVRKLAMPDLDTTLIGLMGISSGTYIGFKFPEKSKSQGPQG